MRRHHAAWNGFSARGVAAACLSGVSVRQLAAAQGWQVTLHARTGGGLAGDSIAAGGTGTLRDASS
ncbi:MAG: hypothetical protein Q8K35_08635 [Thiobacillus sp.]|nr:hypothetical protein [Thiobacillus sp.]MDP2057805.1 hypothetical protein [Thiobacillus sp.]